MSTNVHITITSCRRAVGQGAGRGGGGTKLVPLLGSSRLWLDDMVNLSLGLSFPSPKQSVLVWKLGGCSCSVLVMLLTKLLAARRGAGAALRGGGTGASDTSISRLVDMIG